MSWCRDHLKYVLWSLCTIAFAVPAITLLVLYHHDDVTMNTQGYIVPGGECTNSCGFETCKDVGTVNVSFFLPNDSGDMVTMLVTVPILCALEGDSCCVKYIADHALFWFYVEATSDGYEVKYMSLNEKGNTGSFLFIGLFLLLCSVSGLIVLLRELVCKDHYNSI